MSFVTDPGGCAAVTAPARWTRARLGRGMGNRAPIAAVEADMQRSESKCDPDDPASSWAPQVCLSNTGLVDFRRDVTDRCLRRRDCCFLPV